LATKLKKSKNPLEGDISNFKQKRYSPILKTAAFVMLIVLSICAVVKLIETAEESGIWGWTAADIGIKDYTQTEQYHWRYVFWVSHSLNSAIDAVTAVQDTDNAEDAEEPQSTSVSELDDELAEAEELQNAPAAELGYDSGSRHAPAAELDYEMTEAEIAAVLELDLNFSDTYDFDEVVYYLEIGESVFRNTELDYTQIMQNYNLYYEDARTVNGIPTTYIYAVDDAFIAQKNLELEAVNKQAEELIIFSAVLLAAYLLCFVYLVYGAGRRVTKPGITMLKFDKLFTEIILALFVLSVITCCYWILVGWENELYKNPLLKYAFFTCLTFIFAVGYGTFYSVVRCIKKRVFFKNALIYKLLALVINGFKKAGNGIGFMYSRKNPRVKTIIAITVLGILTMIPFVGIFTIPIALFFALRQAATFCVLKEGILAVKNGDFETPIILSNDIKSGFFSSKIFGKKLKIKPASEFTLLADDVNQIAAGLNEEVERRLKSERLKTELIVNVSHDIRTPLTSLITYTDLLKNEKTNNENIKKYIEIISQKSDRLKTLTDDLFESAKAASGNINVNLETVEVNALLIQALAEFDERIKKSELEVKLNIPQEKLFAHADGRLLWRVIENLMSNALVYSLENSRIYINVHEDSEADSVFIEMKNISKAELNIPEDEITERFKRGDLSRNSEGSGLGLDIATSLMRCQNGELSVKIDGDLFKVLIKMNRKPTPANPNSIT